MLPRLDEVTAPPINLHMQHAQHARHTMDQHLTDLVRPYETRHKGQIPPAVGSQSIPSEQRVDFSLFAREMAHDLNNLLLTIIGFTDLALDEVAEGSLAEANLQYTLQASRSAKLLVQRLLSFDRPMDKELRLIALHTVIEDTLPLLQAALPHHIQLSAAELTPGVILADPAQIQQVLMNLCINAMQAIGQAEGLIAIAVQYVEERDEVKDQPCLGSSLCLSVQDTGCGMSEQVKQRIFYPSFTTKPVGQGNGLGLSIVNRIVQIHGGTLTVDSMPGEGTTFRIYFPFIEKGTDMLQSIAESAELVQEITKEIL